MLRLWLCGIGSLLSEEQAMANDLISRREVLSGAAGAMVGLVATKLGLGAAEPPAKRIPIGLQLYSVRQDCQKDLPRVLEAVAKMGYEGVEFAGYYGRSAKELRKLLDQNGLRCCGTHTGLNTLQGDALAGTIEFNQTLGNPYLIVPWMPHEKLASVEACKKTAQVFNELAEKVKEKGMYVGYHAHAGDFQKVGDQTAWDLFFSFCSPEVVMQMDVGNCLAGGGDPYASLEKFPGRSKTIHLKEHGGPAGACVGEGQVDWKRVFQLCETTGGTQWYIVEQESYGQRSPLQAVQRCLENLKKMGK
jgi:sugar phosphate isomerase/epimerase